MSTANNTTVFKPGTVCPCQKYDEVILIDDDDIYLYLHRYMLTKIMPGTMILQFKKFEYAYNYIRSIPKDNRMLLIDNVSPYSNCLEFLQNLENAGISCKVIVTSIDTPDKVIMVNKNVSSFVKKPATIEKLAMVS